MHNLCRQNALHMQCINIAYANSNKRNFFVQNYYVHTLMQKIRQYYWRTQKTIKKFKIRIKFVNL